MSDLDLRAYRVTESRQPAQLMELSESDLPVSGLMVRVTHSSLNYKDGLAVLGRPGVVRSYPMTCGIDLAGEVVEAEGGFDAGQVVVLTGAGLSESAPGGYSTYQRVDPAYVLPAPARLGARGAMAVGTAGLTAMLSILRLEAAGVRPSQGPVLVTGATGGVGSFAVSFLSALGYEVHAATGKASEHDYLIGLGASAIVAREQLTGESRSLGKETWAAAVDSVGGATLRTVLSQLQYGGVAAACGLAGGFELPTTVMPFILRGVSLAGVDSVFAPVEARRGAWARIESLVTEQMLDVIAVDAAFDDVPELSSRILAGDVRGRVVIRVGDG